MKHGRPDREWIQRTGEVYGPCAAWQGDLRMWRREHALRVWQAMQAVVAVVALVESADSIFSEYWDEYRRLGMGWL